MLNTAGQGLAEGLKLTKRDRSVLWRAGWVILVSLHMLWVWGLLGWAGFAVPFARAAEVQELQKSARISTQIQIQAEIREQGYIYCSSTDDRTRTAASRRIDELRTNLREIAKIDEPRPVCERH